MALADERNGLDFAQALKMRRKALASSDILLVVEGATDRRALLPFLSTGVCIIVAQGKGHVLKAFDSFRPQKLERTVWLVDCDGEIPGLYKGDPWLILSANRDIEADMILELKALERLLAEYLPPGLSVDDLGGHVVDVATHTTEIAAVFGVALDAARSLSAKIKLHDGHSGKIRRVRLYDLPEFEDWIGGLRVPALSSLVADLASVLNWSPAVSGELIAIGEQGAAKKCRQHKVSACKGCKIRRYANGHDLVDVVKFQLRTHSQVNLGLNEVSAMLRISSQITEDWSVVRRARSLQSAYDVQIFS